MPWVCNCARGRGAMKVPADGRWKAVDCGKVVGSNICYVYLVIMYSVHVELAVSPVNAGHLVRTVSLCYT